MPEGHHSARPWVNCGEHECEKMSAFQISLITLELWENFAQQLTNGISHVMFRVSHVCIVLTAFVFLGGSSTHSNVYVKEPDTKTDPSNSIPKSVPESRSQVGPPRPKCEQSSKSENSSQKKTEERPPLWRDPATSNWALVIVGFIASVIAICTLKTISRQTTATEQAVIAAEKSATAADNTLQVMRDTAE
jgi:hypothetical protein